MLVNGASSLGHRVLIFTRFPTGVAGGGDTDERAEPLETAAANVAASAAISQRAGGAQPHWILHRRRLAHPNTLTGAFHTAASTGC